LEFCCGIRKETDEVSDYDTKSGMNRRAVLFAVAGAAPLLALSSTGSEAAATMAPTAVGYQDSPKDGRQCDGCNLFISPNACKTVKGDISPKGWCKIWVKKAA
jgi:hypothetical protein